MADSIEKQNLLLWFSYLHGLQNACSFNTSVKNLDLLTFANSKIVSIAPSANEQAQLIVNAKSAPGFDISTADLATYATFEALLDHFNPLPTYVAAYLQTFAPSSLGGGSLVDFLNASVTVAFPGGSAGPIWGTSLQMLQSVMPAVCFSSKLQVAVAKTVDDGTKKVTDLVNQIATLG
jgi:hypothetical protein